MLAQLGFGERAQVLPWMKGLPAAGGLKNVPLTAVIGRDREVKPALLRGGLFGQGDPALDFGVKGTSIANDSQSNPSLGQSRDFTLQVLPKQLHEHRHLFGGATPVFGAEGKHGQVTHAVRGAPARGIAQIGGATQVTHGPGHHATLGPTAVTVHDDGDVLRDSHGPDSSKVGSSLIF